jgi:hypothetical protein
MWCISVGVLEKIRKKCFHFLWTSKKEKDGMELINWKRIPKPRQQVARD